MLSVLELDVSVEEFAIDVSAWEPQLHPRDSHGRFRDKWGLPPAIKKAVEAILKNFSPATFRSDGHAQGYAESLRAKQHHSELSQASLDYFMTANGAQDIQSTLRAGKEDTPHVRGIDQAMKPLPNDVLLTRVVGPDAFGLPPERIGEVEEWTGRLVSDKGYSPTNLGTPLSPPDGAGHITLSLVVPRGTKAAVPGDSRSVILDREQPYRIMKVTPDGKGGLFVYGVVEPKQSAVKRTPAHNLGKELPGHLHAPATDATPEEHAKRGLNPDGTPMVNPNATAPQAVDASRPDLAQPSGPAPAVMAPNASAPTQPAVSDQARHLEKARQAHERIAADQAAGRAPSKEDVRRAAHHAGAAEAAAKAEEPVKAKEVQELRDQVEKLRKQVEAAPTPAKVAPPAKKAAREVPKKTPAKAAEAAPAKVAKKAAAPAAKKAVSSAPVAKKAAPAAPPAGDNYEKTTVRDLKAEADKRGIKILSRDRKPDIIAKLREHDKGGGTPVKKAATPEISQIEEARKIRAEARRAANPGAKSFREKQAEARAREDAARAEELAKADAENKKTYGKWLDAAGVKDEDLTATDRSILNLTVEGLRDKKISRPEAVRRLEASSSPRLKALAAEVGKSPAAKATPKEIIARLTANHDNPMSREEAASHLADVSRADLLEMVKQLGIPVTGSKTRENLRREIVDATVGRRLDSIATRGFKGARPDSPDLAARAEGRKAARAARQRVAKAQIAADAQATMSELHAKGMSHEGIAKHLRGIASGPSLDEITDPVAREEMKARLEEVAKAFDEGSNVDAVSKLRVLSREHGVKIEGKVKDVVDFNPDKHDHVGSGLEPGDKVQIIKPGAVDAEGRVLHKAVVKRASEEQLAKAAEADRTPIVPLTAVTAKAGIEPHTLSAMQSISEAGRMVRQGKSGEEIAARLRDQADSLEAVENPQIGDNLHHDASEISDMQKADVRNLRRLAGLVEKQYKGKPAEKAAEAVKPEPIEPLSEVQRKAGIHTTSLPATQATEQAARMVRKGMDGPDIAHLLRTRADAVEQMEAPAVDERLHPSRQELADIQAADVRALRHLADVVEKKYKLRPTPLAERPKATTEDEAASLRLPKQNFKEMSAEAHRARAHDLLQLHPKDDTPEGARAREIVAKEHIEAADRLDRTAKANARKPVDVVAAHKRRQEEAAAGTKPTVNAAQVKAGDVVLAVPDESNDGLFHRALKKTGAVPITVESKSKDEHGRHVLHGVTADGKKVTISGTPGQNIFLRHKERAPRATKALPAKVESKAAQEAAKAATPAKPELTAAAIREAATPADAHKLLANLDEAQLRDFGKKNGVSGVDEPGLSRQDVQNKIMEDLHFNPKNGPPPRQLRAAPKAGTPKKADVFKAGDRVEIQQPGQAGEHFEPVKGRVTSVGPDYIMVKGDDGRERSLHNDVLDRVSKLPESKKAATPAERLAALPKRVPSKALNAPEPQGSIPRIADITLPPNVMVSANTRKPNPARDFLVDIKQGVRKTEQSRDGVLKMMKVGDLKTVLKHLGVEDMSGRKDDLVERVHARLAQMEGHDRAERSPVVRELMKMTMKDLREQMTRKGLKVPPRAKKEDLVGILAGKPAGQHHAKETPGIAEIRAAVESGTKDRKYYGDGMSAQVALVEAPDGKLFVRKRHLTDYIQNAKDQSDAENLAARVGQALGADAPDVFQPDTDTVYMRHVPGKSGYKIGDEDMAALARTDRGMRIAIMDAVIGNTDRHNNNWLVGEDGRPVPIDHGLAWAWETKPGNNGEHRPAPYHNTDVFAPHWVQTPAGNNGAEATNPTGHWKDKIEISRAELDRMRARLVRLRPEFLQNGRLDWYEGMLGRMDEIIKRATLP